MNIFFDTEFTGLHKDTTLISIGCVDENNRTFYAELTDYDKYQINDWIQDNVINNLKLPKHGCYNYNQEHTWTNVKGNKDTVEVALRDWLYDYKDVQFVSDVSHYDMVLLINLFGTAFDLPTNVSPSCHDINQDIANYYGISEREAFDKSREDILREHNITVNGDKHNALYDAKVIKEIYNIVKS